MDQNQIPTQIPPPVPNQPQSPAQPITPQTPVQVMPQTPAAATDQIQAAQPQTAIPSASATTPQPGVLQSPTPTPTSSILPPPKGVNKTVVIVLAIAGGSIIAVVLAWLLFTFFGTKPRSKATQTSSSNISNAEPTLPSGYAPIDTICYRIAAPTNNSLDNNTSCFVVVKFGTNKSDSYKIAAMSTGNNASAADAWKKANPQYEVVSEDIIKIDGLDGRKIIYQNQSDDENENKGVVVFVSTVEKKYIDGTFNIPGFEISSTNYDADKDNSKEVFDVLINTWHWK